MSLLSLYATQSKRHFPSLNPLLVPLVAPALTLYILKDAATQNTPQKRQVSASILSGLQQGVTVCPTTFFTQMLLTSALKKGSLPFTVFLARRRS